MCELQIIILICTLQSTIGSLTVHFTLMPSTWLFYPISYHCPIARMPCLVYNQGDYIRVTFVARCPEGLYGEPAPLRTTT